VNRLSLRARFLLFSAALIVAAGLLIGGVAYYEYREGTMRAVDRTLRAKANGVLAALDDEGGPAGLKREADSIVGFRAGKRSPMYRVWRDGSRSDLVASDPADRDRGRWLRDIREVRAPDANSSIYADIGDEHNEFRALWVRSRAASGAGWNVVVAESTHYRLHEIGEMRNILFGVVACAGAVMLLFALLAVRRVLRPIQVVAGHLDRVTYRDIGADALRDSPVPPELRPFVESTAKMLERLRRAFETQERFVADASHELRTPLAVAKSSLQTAAAKGRSIEGYERAVREALEDLDRMQRVIEQLLILARLGRKAEENEAVGEIELEPFLADLAERYDAVAARGGGSVVVGKVAAATLLGRRTQLERLFGNLIENAIVHGPPSGTVTVEASPGDRGDVVVCVHDEGGAIPPEELPHLFDRFYRVDRSRSRHTGGTGLGLAIAREITLGHGGDIRMESSSDHGTCVFVRLPRLPEGSGRDP